MSVGTIVTIVLVVVLLGLALWLLFASLRVIRQYERMVILRLGRFHRLADPGLTLLIPIIDNGIRMDLREAFVEVPSQTCITKDNAPIDIDFLIYWKVVNAEHSVMQVMNFAGAAQGIATTTLRAVVGDIVLDDVLAKREEINRILRTKLDEVTERWGVKVTTVEIREITPPREVQEAMNRQMAAERVRRATVTEAEGKKQANVTVAEGEKQAAILKAEGDRQATILRAEGQRQSAILNAEGFSMALTNINSAAKAIDPKTLSLQYFDTLKNLGTGAATKFIFPMEFTSLLRPFISAAACGDSQPQAGQEQAKT